MTNYEVAKQVWGKINFHESWYADHFDDWYKDCWNECMEEATNYILNGSCSFETGSFIEVSRTLSKDGQTHNIDVDKENFVEFYGEEHCFRLFTLVDDIKAQLINYAAGSQISQHFTNEELELFAEFNRKWNDLPCDDDGFTTEQEKVADELVEDYAQQIFDKMNS